MLSKLLTLVRKADLATLLTALVCISSLWAFLAIVDEVTDGDHQKIDDEIVLLFRNPQDASDPLGPKWLETAARDITSLGGSAILTLVTVAVCGYFLLSGFFRTFFLVLVSTLGGNALNLILKGWFARPRPPVGLHNDHVITASFPSGHSMLSAIVYLTLGALLSRFVPERRLKIYVLVIAIVMAFLVGLTRVYLGVHYLSDVLAGWTAGICWALLCWLIADYLQTRGKMTPGKKPATGKFPAAG